MGEGSIFYIGIRSGIGFGVFADLMHHVDMVAGEPKVRTNLELSIAFLFLTVNIEFKKKRPEYEWLTIMTPSSYKTYGK